jgi:hypothetical protein
MSQQMFQPWWAPIVGPARAAGLEIFKLLRRFAPMFVALPPGATTMKLAVPAFWPRESGEWARLTQAGTTVSFAVVEGSWPATASQDPNWKSQAQTHLATVGQSIGSVLGYVSTRKPGGALKDINKILGTAAVDPTDPNYDPNYTVKAWYDQFGSQIDGIYFDELVLPEVPTAVTEAETLVAAFKQGFTGKVAILAGQSLDERVVSNPDIDWALLWEGHYAEPTTPKTPYRDLFAPLLLNGNRDVIPAWWKDPHNRNKIVHVVHNCSEPERQRALGLAKERNAGHVFVMDRRGLKNPSNPGSDDLYDHLPPYWEREVTEVNSYYDFGFDPLRALRAAHRYATKQSGFIHGWPNFEQAWYPTGHVRGTYLLEAGPHAEAREVLLSDLAVSGQPAPALFDIPRLWAAAHSYARNQPGGGFETALPTFEDLQGGLGTRLILLRPAGWLTPVQVSTNAVYEQPPAPTFAEPGAVIRNMNRVVTATHGNKASFPTFVPDANDHITGRVQNYNGYAIQEPNPQLPAPVQWRDVTTEDYINQL